MQLKEIKAAVSSIPVPTDRQTMGWDSEVKAAMLHQVDELMALVGDDFDVNGNLSRYEESLFDNLDRMYDILGGGDEPPDAESEYRQDLLERVMVTASRLQ